jgi:hypothetical protein
LEEEEANDRESRHSSLFMVFFPLLSSKAVRIDAISDVRILCGVRRIGKKNSSHHHHHRNPSKAAMSVTPIEPPMPKRNIVPMCTNITFGGDDDEKMSSLIPR